MFEAPHFKEFVVNFDNTGLTVEQINESLLGAGIHGGKPLTSEFPQFGQSALYCVTELHRKSDIDALVSALRAILEV